jgi:uncharacterized membrane protein YiaA
VTPQHTVSAVLRTRCVNNEVNNMELTKNLGMLLLGSWLIVTGLLQVGSITIPAIGTVLALLAIGAGVSLLLGR